jgi:hypothetical protein
MSPRAQTRAFTQGDAFVLFVRLARAREAEPSGGPPSFGPRCRRFGGAGASHGVDVRNTPIATARPMVPLFRVLSHNDIQNWADRFLSALERGPRILRQFEQMPSVGS